MNLEEIEEHFKNKYPREGCGVLTVVQGMKKFFPCTNVAEEDEDETEYMEDEKHAEELETSSALGVFG